jgi:uncharacterized protein (TIGR01777 family)
VAPRLFTWKSTIPLPVSEVFAWHTRPGAFERLNPPWRPVRVIQAPRSLQPGSAVAISLPGIGPLRIPWRLQHTEYRENEEFCDEQVTGPFVSWRHRHRFLGDITATTTMLDEISYTLPWYGRPFAYLFTRELQRLFSFRHKRLADDLSLHARWKNEQRQTILVAGASGFIGKALCAFLSTAGHTVRTLVRRPAQNETERPWDPNRGVLDPTAFHGVDVVINLAGEPLLGRWSVAKKQAILESRISTSALFAHTIQGLSQPPRVAIMASAIGVYGDTREIVADENSLCGEDFLATVCKRWEEASSPIATTSCRLVHLRIGTVLSPYGGALKQLLPIFRFGLGGTIGRGARAMSWISMEDLLGIIEHCIYTNRLSGPVNAVSPKVVTNREFTKTLGHVLHRPTLAPVPPVVLRALYGEVADAILLTNSRIAPTKLQESNYTYLYDSLASALQAECGLSYPR